MWENMHDTFFGFMDALAIGSFHPLLWLLGAFVIQLLLCYLAKPMWLRMLPVIVLGVGSALLIIAGLFLMFYPVYLMLMLYRVCFLLMCMAMSGFAWFIWSVQQRLKKT